MYRNDAGIRNKRKTAGAGIPGLLLVFWIGMPRRFVPGKNCLGVYCILGGGIHARLLQLSLHMKSCKRQDGIKCDHVPGFCGPEKFKDMDKIPAL